jgi:Caspase domain
MSRRDALIVGINQYGALPALRAPAADAEAVAHRLESQGEFRVKRLPEVVKNDQVIVGQKTPLNAQVLEDALVQLLTPNGKNIPHTALFYFSGHGLQRTAGVREGYLATSDSDPSANTFGVSLNWLRRLIEQSPIPQIVVWIDGCHSGELFNFSEADPGARQGVDRLFVSASREYEAAYEALDGRHSVFTQALLEGLDPYQDDADPVVNSYTLVSRVQRKLSKGEIQEPLFEISGGSIVLTRPSGLKASIFKKPMTTWSRLKQYSYGFCPYPGIEPFSEAHADYFFGREDLIQDLAHKVKASPFCAVVGASSSGKTSLLRAGLMPALKNQATTDNSNAWSMKIITPGLHPMQSLAGAFVATEADDIAKAEQLRRAETFLKEGDDGLVHLIRASLAAPSSESGLGGEQVTIPCLIIDQFEDLFAPTEDPHTQADRQQFVRCLLKALADKRLPCRIVIALRANHMEDLLRYPQLAHLVENNLFLVTPMTYEQIKAAVVKPADKVGLKLDPKLLYELMLDVTGAPGELSLIQQTLLELWRKREIGVCGGAPRLSLDTYQALGGVNNIVKNRATAVYESLSESEQKAARRIFLALCELGEGRPDGERCAYQTELVNAEYSSGLIEQTLKRLILEKLIIATQEAMADLSGGVDGLVLPGAAWQIRGNQPSDLKSWLIRNVTPMPNFHSPVTFRIAHVSLIQEWPLLRQWLTLEQRDNLRRQRRLEMNAREWQNRKNSDFLLSPSRLKDEVNFFKGHWQELSSLAQTFVTESRHRQRWRLLKRGVAALMVPLALVTGMAIPVVSRHRLPGLGRFSVESPTEKPSITWSQIHPESSSPLVAQLAHQSVVSAQQWVNGPLLAGQLMLAGPERAAPMLSAPTSP